jgi:hypothetical protein
VLAGLRIDRVIDDHRLVTVLVTVSIPAVADPGDAASLLALGAETTGLEVVHTAGVEGHLPVPGSTVLHGRRDRPWVVKAVHQDTATITDLAGGTLEAPLRSLAPDPITTAETTDPPVQS